MNRITETVGLRVRSYRQKKGFSQEYLAERADLHPTYIGQIERGEKNMTIATLEKLLYALGITFAEFFEGVETTADKPSYAERCYDLVHKQNAAEQARMYHILWEIDQLMEASRLGLTAK